MYLPQGWDEAVKVHNAFVLATLVDDEWETIIQVKSFDWIFPEFGMSMSQCKKYPPTSGLIELKLDHLSSFDL